MIVFDEVVLKKIEAANETNTINLKNLLYKLILSSRK